MFNEPILCDSITADGSDFELGTINMVLEGWLGGVSGIAASIVSATGNGCGAKSTGSDTTLWITITLNLDSLPTNYDNTWFVQASATSKLTDCCGNIFNTATGESAVVEGVLPIELLYFNADVIENNRVLLTWATASEINNDYFTVERSVDGVDFEKVTTVKGAGNSIEEINYSAIDESPYLGTSYYRLKQTDYDGKYEYSDIKTVNISKTSDFSIRPNPAKNRLEVLFTESDDAKVFIKILDMRGKLVYSKWFETVKGYNQINLDLHTFSKGMYVITVVNNQVYKESFVKE